MGFSILKDAAEFLREKENRKRWLAIFLGLALLVTAGTIAALAAPGHAMTNKAKVLNCQFQVHVHDQNCLNEEGSLICGQADYVVHTHNDDCYDSAGVLVCRLPEHLPHEHDAGCYTDVRTLICGLEENPGHVHDESCYDRQRNELICTTEEHTHSESCYEREEVLICDKTVQEHVHSDSCYTVSSELSCGLEENGEHTHSEDCYTEVRTLICDLTTEPHVHGPECYTVNETLICTIPEHTHGDDCYSWTETLICEIPEGEGAHAHTEACYEVTGQELSCGELELHTHDDSCYDAEGDLICGQTELLEHVHGEDCFDIIELSPDEIEALNSSVKEPEATEPVSCYDEEGNLICGKAEHSHDESCLDENGSEIVCGKEAHTHITAPAGEQAQEEILTKTYEDAAVRVTASYGPKAEIPADAELRAELIGPESDPAAYGEYLAQMQTAAGEIDLSTVALYDIGFYLPDDSEIEPKDTVNVSIQFADGSGIPGGSLTVVHFAEDKTEILNSVSDGSSVSFDTDSFSLFTFLTGTVKGLFGFGSQITSYGPENTGDGNMTGLLDSVTITDEKGAEVGKDGKLYVGEKYNIHLQFSEKGVQSGDSGQFSWGEDGTLSYQIPSCFEITEVYDHVELKAQVDGKEITVGYYSVTGDGRLTLTLTEEGQAALSGTNDFSLQFDMTAMAQVTDGSISGKVHFGDAGQDFDFEIVDQPRVDVEKAGVFEENGEKTGGALTYTAKTTVKHGQVKDLEICDVLTPPNTTAFDVKDVDKEDIQVTVRRAKSEGEPEVLKYPEDYELVEVPDSESPDKKTFRVRLKGDFTLYEGDELDVSYHYDVAYVQDSTDVFWGNVANDVDVTGTGTVSPPADDPGKKMPEVDIDEHRGSNVEIMVTPPGDGIIFKTQEFSEADHKMHYTLYTMVPAGKWEPFYIQDDMVVEFGGEKYYLPEFKEGGRVSKLKVSTVAVENGALGDWETSDGDQRRQSLEELKKDAVLSNTRYDVYGIWETVPEDDYNSDSLDNYVCLWYGNRVNIVFGEWNGRDDGKWGNWNITEHNTLIITEYDLDMSDDHGEMTLPKMGGGEPLSKLPSEVLRAGIRNNVNMRFGGYYPGYSVFFNNADRMNKTGAPDKSDNTIEFTVTLNTTDTTVNKYFRDVFTDMYAVGWSGDWYSRTMQAVFYDVLPDGWEYVENSLAATARDVWGNETYYPYNGPHAGRPAAPIENVEGKQVISAPLVFFYNEADVKNHELVNMFGETLAQLRFTYKLKASDQWIRDHATDEAAVNVPNHAEIRDRLHEQAHWTADTTVPYLPQHLTKEAEQVGESNLLRFTLHVNMGGADLDKEKNYLIVTDKSENLEIEMSSIQVLDKEGNALTRITDSSVGDGLGKDQWVLMPSTEEGKFRLMVPDETALTIQYNALVPQKGDVRVSNEASIDGVTRTPSSYERSLQVNEIAASGSGSVHELTIEKEDSGDSAVKLSGAKFRFYLVSKGGLTGTEKITVGGKEYDCYSDPAWEFTTGEDGTYKISKETNWLLEPGNYYILVEEEAPAGYFMPEEPILFYYGFENEMDPATYPGAVFALPDGTLTVTNEPVTFEMPHSGGIGTTIFYLVGGLLVAVALVLLITKKRMSREG